DRDKGFFGIGGALRVFLHHEGDLVCKDATRRRLVQGAPLTAQEQRGNLNYCQEEGYGHHPLVPYIVTTIAARPDGMVSPACRLACLATSFNGPWHGRNAAGFRLIDHFSGAFASTGRGCRSTLSPSSTAPSAVTRSPTG